jgi:hypothetical protein
MRSSCVVNGSVVALSVIRRHRCLRDRGFRLKHIINGDSVTQDLLLVGSVPLETAEDVFRVCGAVLGQWLAYIPDGEIGDRRYWVDGLAYRVLSGHPELETIKRPTPDENGVEEWRPRGLYDQYHFRVRQGIEKVRFGDPGWRLGYTRDAISSYYAFRYLKKEGVLPAYLRLQVCLPLPYSAVTSFFPDPADHARIVPGFTESIRAEVQKIVEKIPSSELAIQWDMAVENRYLEATLERDGLAAAEKEAERLLAPNQEITPHIPIDVPIGYHTCFGTLNGWPTRQPADLTGSVLLINAATASSHRPVDFVHIPTLGTAKDEFFKPLSKLRDKARVYLGLIHHLYGFNVRDEILAARKYLPDFGIAAPCGFGRVPERPGGLLSAKSAEDAVDYVGSILKDHVTAVEILHDIIKR